MKSWGCVCAGNSLNLVYLFLKYHSVAGSHAAYVQPMQLEPCPPLCLEPSLKQKGFLGCPFV